ncbi:MAG: transposase [Bacteroidales bacterium]|nr:transposase [Bacteroidales bacterium]
MKKIIRIRHFPTEEACLQYLSEKKWADGFVCPVCGHKHFSSPTSGTLFHKIKFSLLKAFWIIYYHVNNLQAYINEYTFRYNRHIMKRGIFENLLAKVIAHPPKTYKLLYA